MKKEVKRNQDYYNQNADAWSKRGNTFSLEKQFIAFTKYFKQGAKIIDIGCAAGFHVPLFIGLGRKLKYEGFDLSKNLIKIARRRFPEYKFFVADVTQSESLPKGKYDGFWAAAVLMHVPEEDWPLMLKNISRICKPKAIGFILVPQKRPVPTSKKDNRFFTYWTKPKLKRKLDQMSWKILKSGFIYSNNIGDWHWFLVKLP